MYIFSHSAFFYLACPKNADCFEMFFFCRAECISINHLIDIWHIRYRKSYSLSVTIMEHKCFFTKLLHFLFL